MSVRYWLLGVLTLGDFVLLRSYLSQLTEEVRAMGWNVRRIYEAMADANEMTEILLTPHEIKDAENAAILTVPKGMVEFRHVQFSYLVGSNLVLQDFNLKTKPGERVGIVGPSDGGKSTILKLLVRLHDLRLGAPDGRAAAANRVVARAVVDEGNCAHATRRRTPRGRRSRSLAAKQMRGEQPVGGGTANVSIARYLATIRG
jgi:ATPase subunit of ABC transporter with duplicated ATPase domains